MKRKSRRKLLKSLRKIKEDLRKIRIKLSKNKAKILKLKRVKMHKLKKVKVMWEIKRNDISINIFIHIYTRNTLFKFEELFI